MENAITHSQRDVRLKDLPELHPQRLLAVFLQTLLFTMLILVPLVYYPRTNRNFEFPKTMMCRYLLILALLTWMAASRHKIVKSLRERARALSVFGAVTVLVTAAVLLKAPEQNRLPLVVLGILPFGVLVGVLIVGGTIFDLRSPLKLPALVYLTGVSISCLAAPNMTECVDVGGIMDHFLHVFLALAVYQKLARRKTVHFGVVLMLTVGTLIAIVGVAQYFRVDKWLEEATGIPSLALSAQGECINDPVSTLGNRNFVGEYQEVLFPIALLMILAVHPLWAKCLCALAAAAMDGHLVVADTTGADVGLLLGLLVMLTVALAWWPERRKHLLFVVSGWLMVGGQISFYRVYWDRVAQYRFYQILANSLRLHVRNATAFHERVADFPMSIPLAYRMTASNLSEVQAKLTKAIQRGTDFFDKNWVGLLQSHWIGLALFYFVLILYYLIPWVFQELSKGDSGGGTSRGTSFPDLRPRTTKRYFKVISVALAALLLGPLYYLGAWIFRELCKRDSVGGIPRGTSSPDPRLQTVKRYFAVFSMTFAVIAVLILVPRKISLEVDRKQIEIAKNLAQGRLTERHPYLRPASPFEEVYADGTKASYFRPSPLKEDKQFKNAKDYGAMDYILDKGMSRTFVFRSESWRGASRNIISNLEKWHGFPFFGIGVLNFKVTNPMRKFESQLERTILGKEVLARKVHNDYITVGLEDGLLGILGIFWFVAIVFRSIYVGLLHWRNAKNSASEGGNARFSFYILMGLLMSFIATLFHTGVSSNLYQPAPAMMFWFFCGLVPGIASDLGGQFAAASGVSERWRRFVCYGPRTDTAPSSDMKASDDRSHPNGTTEAIRHPDSAGRSRPLYQPFFRNWSPWQTVNCVVFPAVFLIFFGWIMHHWLGESYIWAGKNVQSSEIPSWESCREYIAGIESETNRLATLRENLTNAQKSGPNDEIQRIRADISTSDYEIRLNMAYVQSYLDNGTLSFREEYPKAVQYIEDNILGILKITGSPDSSAAAIKGAAQTAANLQDYVNEVINEAYDHVYERFNKSIAFYPQYMETYYIVGRYYIDGASHEMHILGELNTERLERGVEALERDIYMNPNYKWAHNNLGVIYDELAVIYDVKADNLDKLAQEEGDSSSLKKRAEQLRSLAARYREKGRGSYEKALEIDPDQIFALNNLGSGYFRQAERIMGKRGINGARESLEKGKPYFIDAIRVEPTTWKHYASLAITCLWLRQFEEAIPYVEWAVFAEKTSITKKYGARYSEKIADVYRSATSEIVANPGARPGLKNPEIVAAPLTETEKLDRAIRIYSEIKSGEKEGGSQWYLISLRIAETKEQKGDYAGSIREIESTFGETPKSPAAWINLAACYALNGDREKSKDVLSKRIVAPTESDLNSIIDDITTSSEKRRLLVDEMRKQMKERKEKEEAEEALDENPPDVQPDVQEESLRIPAD